MPNQPRAAILKRGVAENILVVSHRGEDIEFGRDLARVNGWSCHIAKTKNQARDVLLLYSEAILLWNAENAALYDGAAEILPKYAKLERIIAVTDKGLSSYPHLYRAPVFGQHLFRRYDAFAHLIATKLVQALVAKQRWRFADYFPAGTPLKKLVITRSAHKRAAIDAIQNTLAKQGIRGRLAALVAQATDELILNAIFHAPRNLDGSRKRREAGPNEDFQLEDREEVDVELAETDAFMGICVRDDFGSLNRRLIFDTLKQRFDTKVGPTRAAAGIGLNGIMQAGLSLICSIKSGQNAEVMLFFPKVTNYKDFRAGFRFLSIQEES